MENYRTLACRMRYALMVVLLSIGSYSVMSQEVDLTFTTSYSNLPMLDAQSVRQDNKVFATLILNDFSFKEYNVKLNLSIEGNGVSITTNAFSNYKGYTLIPGVPTVISAFDLGDYFDPQGLTFTGVDKNLFLEKGVLPEGNYKLCFTVIDGQSDGINALSNTDCDYLTLKYTNAPTIVSSTSEAINTNNISWKSNTTNQEELDYEVVVYEYKGGDVNSAPVYQLPTKSIKATSSVVDIRPIVKALNKGKLYTFFIRAKSKLGFNHFIKNNGYSNGLLYERQLRDGDCDEDLVVSSTIFTVPGGQQYIHFYVEGCDPYIPPQYSNNVPYVYPYHEDTGYDVQILCDDGCKYDGTHGDQNCIVGDVCTTSNGCYGRIDYGCVCDPWCVQITLTPGLVDGVRSLIPEVPADCDNPQFLWSDGSIGSTVEFPNEDATFSLVITCPDSGCTYCGIINSRGNCIVGSWCNDGNPCTINDEMDANCDCIGTPIEHCEDDDPDNTGGCADDLSITLSEVEGLLFLSTSLECNQIQYRWNNDETLTDPALFILEPDGVYTLDVLCDGCSYTASIDLSCTEGDPCDDDNDPTTIEIYNEVCECVTLPCPDFDNDGLPDDCDEDQACNGSISITENSMDQLLTLDVSDIECPDEVTYSWSTGATTSSIPHSNPNATYSVTVTCSDGCQYTATIIGDNEDCIVGESCEGTSCLGEAYLDENCNCIDVDPDYTFTTEYQVISYGANQGQVTVTMKVDEEICEEPSFKWNTGQEGASIVITNLEATYIVTVTCDACEFVAYYNLNTQDCVIGAPCDDGEICTYYDTFNEDCECIGVYNEDSDGNQITDDCIIGPCTDGLACDDGDPCTYFDVVYSDACCIGFYLVDADGNVDPDCVDGPCIIGAACDDGNPCTVGDVYDEDCNCAGETTPDCNDECTEDASISISPTDEYDEVLLTALITNCDSDVSYQWSNGSTVQSIVVNGQTGTYSVIITCGDCTYTAYYNTNGCLVGLPCNDGLDCTENDVVQENCECEGTNIEGVDITFSTIDVTKNLCDYKICLGDWKTTFYIKSVDVILPSGEYFAINQALNGQGFDFPYTSDLIGPNSYYQLISDLNAWLPEPAQVSLQYSDNDFLCGQYFLIRGSSIEIVQITGFTTIIPGITLPATIEGTCNDNVVIGTNLSAVFDCEDIDGVEDEVFWSNGESGPTIYIDDINSFESCLEVTVICANGCIYTETYVNELNCEGCHLGHYGAPCDDMNPCTTGDIVDENCKCIGLPLPDSDGDGVCDDNDICPFGDDNIDLDEDGIPDACDDEINCTAMLSGEIVISNSTEPCIYCLLLDDPIFTDQNNTEEIYLQSISILENGSPKLLNSTTEGFSFPYLIDKSSPTLLPQSIIDDLNAFLGGNGDVDISLMVEDLCFKSNGGGVGPNLFGYINQPTILQQMKFVWGGSNVIKKDFYKSIEIPCETNTPFTLTAEFEANNDQGCEGVTYLWSTGSTESFIEVASTLPEYSVTITCGVCEVVIINEGCTIDEVCTAVDICGYTYSGVYDEYCNCIPEFGLLEYSYFQGVLDCDECDDDYKQISEDGDLICCDDPPVIVHETTQVTKEVINYCYNFKENDLITRINIKGITLLASNDNETVGDGTEDGNFFHFPYCIENNCGYYQYDAEGNEIDIPYVLYDYKRLAYDLQQWAMYNGYNFTTSVTYLEGFCDGCQEEGYTFYINGMEPSTSASHNKVFVFDQGLNPKSMNSCNTNIEGGYMVQFEEYVWEGCKIVSLEVNTSDASNPTIVTDPSGINLGEHKFGPVPHKGVGFKARIIVECTDENGISECSYEIVTPDADCIVGDPCASTDVCASETYTTYNNEDCVCQVINSNDSDGDGVCDEDDICPGQDDTIDTDGDGIPNCLDPICGAEDCTYILDLSTLHCDDPGGNCMIIGDITVKLPNDVEESLGLIPFFEDSYIIGEDCINDQSESLVNYIKRWFYNNDYIVKDVSVNDLVLTISGSNIEFLFAKNGCKEVIEFTETCLAPSCNYSIFYTEDIDPIGHGNECILIEDILIEIDGESISLKDNYPTQFRFPYCANSSFNSCDNICLGMDKLADHLQSTFEMEVEVLTEGTPENFTIGLIISYTDKFFVEAIINGDRIPFVIGKCQFPCDDNWDCTINDHYDENCNCVGTFLDSDGDTVCDADDQCPGESDLVDFNQNGIPDGCENGVNVKCEDGDIPFCEYLANILEMVDMDGQSICFDGRIVQNNLIAINDILSKKFKEDPNALDYLPFPILKEQLASQAMNPLSHDIDEDGIVTILDPAPDEEAFLNNLQLPFPDAEGLHDLGDDDVIQNINVLCNWGPTPEYVKERALLLRTFMFTVNPGVLVGTSEDDSGSPILSPCIEEFKVDYELDETNYNSSGYIYSNAIGCYVYFEVGCDCECIIKESYAINYDGGCDQVVGEECTEDSSLENEPGYHYVQCPPDNPDPCISYSIVGNASYNAFDHQEQGEDYNEEPCECVGQPMADSDGDGICDILDECPGEEDTDIDQDGIPDCRDKCVNISIDPEFTKEGYAPPTGPGDVCDDGNPCTYDDVITLDCICQGVYIDTDDDGIYDCEECEYVVVETVDGKDIYGPEPDCAGCGGTVTVDDIGNVTDPEANPVANTWTGCDVCPGIPDGDPEDIGGQYPGDLPMDYNDNGLPDCIDPPYYPIGCPYHIAVMPNEGIILYFEGSDINVDDLPNPISISITATPEGGGFYYSEYTILEYTRETVDVNGAENLEAFYAATWIQDFYFADQEIIVSFGDHQPCVFGTDNPVAQDLCPTFIEYYNGELVLTYNYSSDDIVIDYATLIGDYMITYPGPNNTMVEIPFVVDASHEDFSNANTAGFEIPMNDLELPDVYEIIIPGGQTCLFDGGELEAPCNGSENKPCDDGKECTYNDKTILIDGNCVCQGIDKPNSDNDIYCDEIDPCPDFDNAVPTEDITGEGDVNHLDINDCPCPEFKLSTLYGENPVLENGSDFVLYLSNDISEYTNIVYSVDNLADPTLEGNLPLTSPIIISNLLPGYEYTITISAFCGLNEAGSESYTVYVPFSDNPIICGAEMEKTELTSLTLLPSISAGEDFEAADFVVNIKDIEGSYGKFSGSGYVSVPYFNQARMNVKFDNITISADRQLVDGFVYVTGIGLAVLGDDLSDQINGQLDDVINGLEDVSELIDEIVDVLEEIEDYLNSVKDLVTEENLECYLLRKGILEELIAQYEEDNTSVTEDQLKQATVELKDCFNGAHDDAVAAVSELMELIEYSFVQFNISCAEIVELSNSLEQAEFNVEQSLDIVENLFSEFEILATPSITPLSSSSISGTEFSVGINSNSNLSQTELMNNPLVAAYYESEKELFLCNVSKLIIEQGIFDSDNSNYDQLEAENTLNTIIIAITNAGANMAKEFAPELLGGVTAENIFNQGDNADKIKEMISDALANEVYK